MRVQERGRPEHVAIIENRRMTVARAFSVAVTTPLVTANREGNGTV
jgi:hypothetical protein